MKTLFRSTLFISLFMLLGAPSIYFDILVPAVVDIPSNIKTVALIDRSHSESDVVNAFEKGILSSISGKSDRISKNCIEGVNDQLNSREGVKPLVTGIILERKGTALDFPEPLDWKEIDDICKQHSADAVISLEIFSRHYAENVAEVKVGYRIYDPSRRKLLDEFQYYHAIGKERIPSEDPGALVLNALNSDDAIKESSYIAGTIYGKRISPYWIRVKRDYFKRSKKDPNLAEGARMMEVNDWEAAVAAFKLAIEQGHPKTRGRAAHNLAIVYEINGDIDLALLTAREAWGKYGNKAAREYAEILQQRQAEMNLLKMQENS